MCVCMYIYIYTYLSIGPCIHPFPLAYVHEREGGTVCMMRVIVEYSYLAQHDISCNKGIRMERERERERERDSKIAHHGSNGCSMRGRERERQRERERDGLIDT